MALITASPGNFAKLLDLQKQNLDKLGEIQTVLAGSAGSQEDQMENSRKQDQMLVLLGILAQNTIPTNSDKAKEAESGGGIGLIGAGLAVALGSLVGVIQGQLKAIKMFGKLLIPEAAIAKIGKSFKAVVTFLSDGVKSIQDMISKVFGSIKGLFKSKSVTGIADVFGSVVKSVKAFFAPIGDALAVIKSNMSIFSGPSSGVGKLGKFFGAIKDFFSGIGSKIGSFGRIFSSVAKIVGRIFYPLTVIMTLWDTVKGAIAGFSEGGIIGGISGAIKGFFNSLITAPLDMIKDAVSWVLDLFGFENASKVLDSFSFTDTFNGMVDGMIEFVTSIPTKIGELITEWIVDPLKNMFAPIADFFKKVKDDIMSFVEDFGIPEISFTIPIIDKKVSIGPFFPFRPDEGTERIAANTTTASGVDADGTETSSLQDNITNTQTDKSYAMSTGDDGSYLAELDTETGTSKVSYEGADGEEYEKEISNSAFRQIRAAAEDGADTAAIAEIIKEDEAYQKLSWWQKRKVDVGYEKATDIVAADPELSTPSTGGVVASASANNDQAKMDAARQGMGNTTVISAPVSNSSNTTQTMPRSPSRAPEKVYDKPSAAWW
jgi:hypothetical protein